MSPERAIAQLARRQHALVTYRQLNQLGLNEKQIRRRQQSGQFSLVRPSVVRIAGAPETRHSALLAVCLSAGPPAFVSGSSAASLWGAWLQETEVIRATTDRSHRIRLTGVAGKQSDDLWGVTRRAGVPTSNPVRLLFDLAADGEAGSDLEAAFDHLNLHHLISGTALLGALELRCRPGIRGVTVVRDLLNDRLIGTEISDSQLEAIFADFVRRFSLPDFEFHPKFVFGGKSSEPDFCHREARVLIEMDGFGTHGRRQSFENDRQRDIRAAAHGWLTLRVTWRRLMREPQTLAAEIRSVLQRRLAA
jgi:very-short-patch-repair endonuclease